MSVNRESCSPREVDSQVSHGEAPQSVGRGCNFITRATDVIRESALQGSTLHCDAEGIACYS